MREGRHGRGGGFEGHHAGPRGGRFGHGEGPRGWSEDGPGFGRGGGRRRMFDGGELRLVLLKLIADKPRHGYDLIRAIEERTGGAYAPSPGIVYPTLTMLSEMGLIDEQLADGARKLFAITPEGTAHLAEHEAEVVAMLARLDALGADARAHRCGSDPPRVAQSAQRVAEPARRRSRQGPDARRGRTDRRGRAKDRAALTWTDSDKTDRTTARRVAPAGMSLPRNSVTRSRGFATNCAGAC